MGLSATRPAVIEGVVLNDIGPVLDPAGIARIASYVGKTAVPRSLPEAVAILKGMMADRFTALSEADWIACAKATFVDSNGEIRSLYDENLMKAFAEVATVTPLPTFWPFFEGLRERPLLVVRGANSDLLSPETVAEMALRHKAARFMSSRARAMRRSSPTLRPMAGSAASWRRRRGRLRPRSLSSIRRWTISARLLYKLRSARRRSAPAPPR